MATRQWVGALSAAVWLLSACDAAEGVRPCSEARSGEGCVMIVQEVGGSLVRYPEGFVSFVRIQGDGLDIEAPLEGVGLERPRTLSVALAQGSYVLTSFQRQCGPAGCDASGPELEERDSCSEAFRILPGQETTVRIAVQLGEGCTVSLS